jgi:hypothetical protein
MLIHVGFYYVERKYQNMIFVSNEIYFSNGWDCRKCGKMTEHLKDGGRQDAKQICTICGSYNVIVEAESGFANINRAISKRRITKSKLIPKEQHIKLIQNPTH